MYSHWVSVYLFTVYVILSVAWFVWCWVVEWLMNWSVCGGSSCLICGAVPEFPVRDRKPTVNLQIICVLGSSWIQDRNINSSTQLPMCVGLKW